MEDCSWALICQEISKPERVGNLTLPPCANAPRHSSSPNTSTQSAGSKRTSSFRHKPLLPNIGKREGPALSRRASSATFLTWLQASEHLFHFWRLRLGGIGRLWATHIWFAIRIQILNAVWTKQRTLLPPEKSLSLRFGQGTVYKTRATETGNIYTSPAAEPTVWYIWKKSAGTLTTGHIFPRIWNYPYVNI